MDHTIEELRLGERLHNPYADDAEMTVWFHLPCGAYRRPEAFLQASEDPPVEIEGRQALREAARKGIEHRRLPRAEGVQRSPTGSNPVPCADSLPGTAQHRRKGTRP